MAKMTILYKTPKDKEAFDRHYFEVHAPMAKKLSGLRKYEVSKGQILSPTGNSETYFISILHFDSLEAIKTAFASPQGKSCAADRKILAPENDDVQFYIFDTEEL